MKKSITVIGGANVDIGGRPAAALALHDSNPGLIRQRFGGVARNVAHNLCLLGQEVRLIAALGGDIYGETLRKSCSALGMDLSMALLLPERRSSTYLYVTDENGDMLIGIADMDITASLTPAALAGSLARINASDAVVIDANLAEETLLWLGEHVTAPLYADPVSTAKAPRLRPLLGKLRALKPNLLEAEILTGEGEPAAALNALLSCGVQRVFLSLGANGMLAGAGSTRLALPCEARPVVNTTGAGDAALAALIWADLLGLELRGCAEAALRAGAITCTCEETNHPDLAAQMGV